MSELISIENLITEAKKRGIDFGKGDPYNRLRYYTKIGWLPHMVRKRDEKGSIRGHYEREALEQLITIEGLKAKGISNDDIAKQIKVQSKFQTLLALIKSKEIRSQFVTYISLLVLLLILGNELGIIKLNKPKDDFSFVNQSIAPKQVMDSGTSFVPKGQKKIVIQTPLIKNTYKVYVTFNQEYSPAVRYWISNIEDYKGFTLELDTPVFNNTEFNWWITN